MRIFLKFIILSSFLAVSGCQTPDTVVSESDESLETRVFSKVTYGDKVELEKAVIIDVRSRFEFEMSRLPRSFHAYWRDWDLRNLRAQNLERKKDELQRLLALKGVDPLVRVVVLGKGLKGQGEEFLVGSTLLALGVEKINFMTYRQAKKAVVSKNPPPLENVPYWSKSLKHQFHCDFHSTEKTKIKKQADVLIGADGLKPSQVFDEKLRVRKRSYPKIRNTQVYSPDSLWAYGLVMHFIDQGRNPCVL